MQKGNKKNSTAFTVKQPTTLLPFIMEVFNGISRSKAKAILAGGGVCVEGTTTTQYDMPLSPGMKVEISKGKQKVTISSKYVRLVYEDAHIVVIEKAVGILSMPTDHHMFCVKTLLDDYFHRSHQKCTAHVVHRLDRDTSGLMVYAKSIRAEQILEHNWHDIVTDRRYVALVSGEMRQNGGTVESWLRDNKAFFTYSSHTDNGGKFARTHFATLRRGGGYTLVELKLETGRKNQIRVHMQDLQHPVCGDTKYGNGDNPIGRLALHAFRLDFFHPITNEQLHFETPVPAAFLKPLESRASNKRQ